LMRIGGQYICQKNWGGRREWLFYLHTSWIRSKPYVTQGVGCSVSQNDVIWCNNGSNIRKKEGQNGDLHRSKESEIPTPVRS
jgi:hypothetical protein